MVLSNIGRVCRRPFKAFLQQCKKAFFLSYTLTVFSNMPISLIYSVDAVPIHFLHSPIKMSDFTYKKRVKSLMPKACNPYTLDFI